MSLRNYLGEYELLVLLAVLALGDKAYGVPIARELEEHRGGEVSIGSIYAVLDRLEARGWLCLRSAIQLNAEAGPSGTSGLRKRECKGYAKLVQL